VGDTRIGGIEVIEVDGGMCENVNISDVTLHNTRPAIVLDDVTGANLTHISAVGDIVHCG
jgi:hypothetical protein